MEIGEILGKGMTAEVYEYGKDKVLKLFHQKFTEKRIEYEANIGLKVYRAGIPSPALYGIVDVNDRKGIIFQRVFGKSILRCVEAEPLKLIYYAQQMAGLHYQIHQHSVEGLPKQKEKLAPAIAQSSQLLGFREKRILDYLHSLPEGTSVCHGDLHFENIIVSDQGLVAIDWTNAYSGNPHGDVARALLTILSPAMPIGTSKIMLVPYMYGKWLTYWGYVNEYTRLAQVGFDSIDAWILPVAAARLKDEISGEKQWLMNTIDIHLGESGA